MDPENEPEVVEEPITQEPEAGGEETTTPPSGVETIPPQEPDFETQLQTERETSARLQGRLDAQSEQATPPPKEEPPPKEFTRAELRTAVEEGKIDSDQLETIWADQNHAKTLRDTEAMINRRDADRTVELTVDGEYDKYVAAYPDLKNEKSAIWGKVKKEYDFMVRMGHAGDKKTELTALRSALGSHERIPERTAELRETPAEIAGTPGGGTRPVDIWNRVPKSHKAYYKTQVEKGIMTLEDVKKTIPYMTQDAPQRTQ